jgi:hypothetical protein
MHTTEWPELEYRRWRETSAALHLFLQIVGKYRLARTPWLNHAWHATHYVTSRGLTTSPVPDNGRQIEIRFDFIDHRLIGEASDGRTAGFDLRPMTVAGFHSAFLELLAALGGTPKLHGRPNELPDTVPFADDRRPRPYDAEAVNRYWRALLTVDRVFRRFRTGFLGKVSPVHLFWGSFDLAVTRFSGRRAPRHPGGIPHLPDAVTREAYSHEVSSAGLWPGGGPIEFAAFYAYAYPAPEGFATARVRPAAAEFNTELGEFLLPYDAVRAANDPEAELLAFLESTYRAAADLGRWSCAELECSLGEPLQPRRISANSRPDERALTIHTGFARS